MTSQPHTPEELDYKSLFEQAPGLLLLLDTNLQVVAVSDSYAAATRTRREEIVGKHLFQIFPGNPDQGDVESTRNLRSSFRRVLLHRKPDTVGVQRFDIPRPEADGGGYEARYWSPINVPIFSAADPERVAFIMHRVQDVTDLVSKNGQAKQADTSDQIRMQQMEADIINRTRELNQALKSLELRNKELTSSYAEMESFSYTVSHDLRAPLRAINAYSTMLSHAYSGSLDDEGKRFITNIKENTDRMAVMIDELLSLAYLGRKDINKTTVDMNELANRLVYEMAETTTTRTEYTIEVLHDAVADPALLEHVLTNLLSNALKYSAHRDRPAIRIWSYREGGELIYAMRDNGAGFDMAYAGKLFGVFERLHSKKEFEGTGIGLAIVKRIIQRHNGRVWAEGRVNEGATFYFSLPH